MAKIAEKSIREGLISNQRKWFSEYFNLPEEQVYKFYWKWKFSKQQALKQLRKWEKEA